MERFADEEDLDAVEGPPGLRLHRPQGDAAERPCVCASREAWMLASKKKEITSRDVSDLCMPTPLGSGIQERPRDGAVAATSHAL